MHLRNTSNVKSRISKTRSKVFDIKAITERDANARWHWRLLNKCWICIKCLFIPRVNFFVQKLLCFLKKFGFCFTQRCEQQKKVWSQRLHRSVKLKTEKKFPIKTTSLATESEAAEEKKKLEKRKKYRIMKQEKSIELRNSNSFEDKIDEIEISCDGGGQTTTLVLNRNNRETFKFNRRRKIWIIYCFLSCSSFITAAAGATCCFFVLQEFFTFFVIWIFVLIKNEIGEKDWKANIDIKVRWHKHISGNIRKRRIRSKLLAKENCC